MEIISSFKNNKRRYKMNSLTPYSRQYLDEDGNFLPITITPEPLSVLARTHPEGALSILNRQLDLVERKMVIDRSVSRTQSLVSISGEHTDQIIAMIQKNDKPNVSAVVRTKGILGRRGFWSDDVESVDLQTTFEGRSW
jgi:hypothetical protein